MKSDYYVYALVDPRDGKAFYVGKGRGRRMYQHLAEWRRRGPKSKSGKLQRIDDIIKAGLRLKVAVLKRDLKEGAAFKLERELINRLKRLTNGRSGDYRQSERDLDAIRRLRAGTLLPTPWICSFARRRQRWPTEIEMDYFAHCFAETMSFARRVEGKTSASA